MPSEDRKNLLDFLGIHHLVFRVLGKDVKDEVDYFEVLILFEHKLGYFEKDIFVIVQVLNL